MKSFGRARLPPSLPCSDYRGPQASSPGAKQHRKVKNQTAIIAILAILISGCGWAHCYGEKLGSENYRAVAPYWETHAYAKMTWTQDSTPDSTTWLIDVTLLPDGLHTPDSSRIDSVEIFTSGASRTEGERIRIWGADYFRLTRPLPKALILRAYYSLWHRRGNWSSHIEEFYLPHHKQLEAYVGDD